MKALSIKSDREIWLSDVAATTRWAGAKARTDGDTVTNAGKIRATHRTPESAARRALTQRRVIDHGRRNTTGCQAGFREM